MLRGVFPWMRSLLVLAPFVIACSGSQPNPETPEGGSDTSATSNNETSATGDTGGNGTGGGATTGDIGKDDRGRLP